LSTANANPHAQLAGTSESWVRADHGLAGRFDDVDWAFPTSRSIPPHGAHPYPARFIPEIPAAAVRLAEGIRGNVFDPFCGSGTTLVEAIAAGRAAVGIDLNPIATLISRVKVRKWTTQDDKELDAHAVQLKWSALRGNNDSLDEARQTIPRLDHWFSADSQALLAGATAYARSIDDAAWRDRVLLAISAAVVRLSRQESETRYAAVEKSNHTTTSTALLDASLMRVAAQLRAFSTRHSGMPAIVYTGDASEMGKLVASESVALAAFSPPYPNAYEYWLYHKYRMYWIGFDPLRVREKEIGARPHYSGSGKATADTFAEQMRQIIATIHRVLVRGGLCFVVVGDSIIKGTIVDNAALFTSLASDYGMELVGRVKRPIRRTRRSFNLAVARATHEDVLLFVKP
jgi:DNA modification methylase